MTIPFCTGSNFLTLSRQHMKQHDIDRNLLNLVKPTLKMMTMSKLRRLKPTRSRLTMATSGMATTVKGISTSSTRQLTVGMTKAVLRKGTPLNPSSLKGISNSRFRSLQCGGQQTQQAWPSAGEISNSRFRSLQCGGQQTQKGVAVSKVHAALRNGGLAKISFWKGLQTPIQVLQWCDTAGLSRSGRQQDTGGADCRGLAKEALTPQLLVPAGSHRGVAQQVCCPADNAVTSLCSRHCKLACERPTSHKVPELHARA